MEHGPYLLFLRASYAFSDHHSFEDWPPLDGLLGQQLWGENSVITMYSKPSDLGSLCDFADAPEWVDYLELASIAVDYAGHTPTNRKRVVNHYGKDTAVYYTEPDTYYSTINNLMLTCNPGSTPDKRTFDKRLLLMSLLNSADSQSERVVQELRRRLGRTAAVVWHSRDVFGIAFKDAKPPALILQSLEDLCRDRRIDDIGVFKLCGSVQLQGAMSPMQAFLGS